ncbi:MAG: epoxyqueuosine reductase QueH [Coriobacteriia bacterium]|nr:epoxyqueuosine reductase QueH [Coriobacteriia bacterium]MCL2749407.1 epoxyqueuosine reductase QueH [Coriobacteriia bacterium]
MIDNDKTLLLHCCCAPCSLIPLETYLREQQQLSLYFYNPNIHPKDEYLRRLDTLRVFLDAQGVSLELGAYDCDAWEEQVGVWGGPYPLIEDSTNLAQMELAKKKRCRACYDLRFKESAAYAAAHGLSFLDTTLTISPYQFVEEVHSSLVSSAEVQGLEALETDWRKSYHVSVQRSQSLGMYRQNYCGCRYSKEEAQIERKARKTRLEN